MDSFILFKNSLVSAITTRKKKTKHEIERNKFNVNVQRLCRRNRYVKSHSLSMGFEHTEHP